jgi:hypothetical protein
MRGYLVLVLGVSMVLSSGLSEAQQKRPPNAQPAPKPTSTTSRTAAADSTLTRDPFVGVWKLSAKKSHYESGGAPKSLTRTYEDRGDGTMVMTTDVNTSEGSTRSYLVYKRDGKPYPEAALGATSFRLVTVRSVDPRNEELFFIVDGKTSDKPSTITISPDGKTMTQVVSVKNSKGETFTNTVVYEKER